MPIRRRGSQARAKPHRRSPFAAPRPRSVETFEEIVGRAIDGLPPEIGRLLDNVAIVIDDQPNDHEGLYGLYEGMPAIEYAADWVPFPNKISLFRLPLEEDFPDPDELADRDSTHVDPRARPPCRLRRPSAGRIRPRLINCVPQFAR
jgi:predicted Zn-dependent protease with MMP-like domain